MGRITQGRRCLHWWMVAILGLLSLVGCSREPELIGTKLEPNQAPDFTLTDHRGQTVRLSDFRGNAVALTFIYTNCQDICPLIAERLNAAYEQLPEGTQDQVALLAVTVDPERDTPAALRRFTEERGLGDNPSWYALTGERTDLEQVWQSYYIDPGDWASAAQDQAHEHAHEHATPATNAQESGTPTASPEEVLTHTDAIYIIDPEGRRRILMRSDADPKAIAGNLEALAG